MYAAHNTTSVSMCLLVKYTIWMLLEALYYNILNNDTKQTHGFGLTTGNKTKYYI